MQRAQSRPRRPFGETPSRNDRAVIAALAALGQYTRLEVFRLLARAGSEGVPAGEIAARLAIVQNTMSAHLKVLDHAGLVRAERDGRIVRYVADMTASVTCSPI